MYTLFLWSSAFIDSTYKGCHTVSVTVLFISFGIMPWDPCMLLKMAGFLLSHGWIISYCIYIYVYIYYIFFIRPSIGQHLGFDKPSCTRTTSSLVIQNWSISCTFLFYLCLHKSLQENTLLNYLWKFHLCLQVISSFYYGVTFFQVP